MHKSSFWKTIIPLQKPAHKNRIRVVYDKTIPDFHMLLKEQTWDKVYNAVNVNRMFNNFLCPSEVLLKQLSY
jgi:hypothetical protein